MSENIHDVTGQGRTGADLLKQMEKIGLRGGGGGPYDPSVEQRVANLEKRMDRVETKLDTLNERVAEVSGKVSMLPGYPGIAIIMTIVGGALLVVSRLFPAGPPSP
ncbi:hypothetical protein [Pseudooceanicola sp.]|uniref:hypothetical protein n=1 Tax=Pseudooceanicola sp. TaxID=1914328 RepID=UPI0035C71050